MKTTCISILIFFLLGVTNIQAQQRTTKETKVVLVVNQKSNNVTHMELLEEVKRASSKRQMLKKYPGSKFYIGLLSGSFSKDMGQITPAKGSTITMFTHKEYFPGDNFFPSDDFFPGDNFKLGETNTKVVSSKKGELILKTQ